MNIIQFLGVCTIALLIGFSFILFFAMIGELMWGLKLNRASERQEERIWGKLKNDKTIKQVAKDIFED